MLPLQKRVSRHTAAAVHRMACDANTGNQCFAFRKVGFSQKCRRVGVGQEAAQSQKAAGRKVREGLHVHVLIKKNLNDYQRDTSQKAVAMAF